MSKDIDVHQLSAQIKNYSWREWPALRGQTNHIRCGVLIPMRVDHDITVYAGLRSGGLEKHAGEICFPGGRPEKEDANLEATALREASEEMGISGAQLIGRLSSMPLYTSNYRLEPFVGIMGDELPVADGAELVAVLPVSMRELLSRPRINALAWDDNGTEKLSPVFELSNRLMFGATAYVLYELLTICAPILGVAIPPMEKGPYTWDDIVKSTKVSAE